ncbi:Hypothetical predicted protein [Olea europaea subsp. europaea]|uniref:Uncharacterized protein n=1 Tax=Olea europaea subsp. europaea TaxID=158383 RepID=A0A8S0T926_OLEEU|nr:Hypothetical predicted protein [Olea europaea subsp. europaea]
MDACFLSSNSFTKTVEVLPSVKGRIPGKNLNQYLCRKSGNPFSIACCQSGTPSSSPLDELMPYINTDWRAFRARLVARDRALNQVEPSLMVDQDTIVSHPQQYTIGDEWAHTIHEPERGCLLIATEKLNGVHIFQKTVILLLSTGPIGPTGVILNRASLMSIKEMGSSALDVSGTFSNRPLFFGGPLEEGVFLVTPREGNDSVGKSGVFDEVMKGLYFGTKESLGCAAEMVKSRGLQIF